MSSRSWATLTAVFVGVTALTWSWSSSVRDAANVAYWALVLVLGVSFLLRARDDHASRRWLVVACSAGVALGATALWSLAPETTIRETIKFGAVLAVAGLAGARLSSSREAGERLARALSFLAPAALLLTGAIAFAATWAESVPREGGVSGLFNGSNALSIFLALTFPFALAHPSVSRRSSMALALSGIVAFVTALSGGRGGLLALLLVVVVFELGTRRWMRLVPTLAAVLLGAGLAIVWAPTVPTVGEPLAATEVRDGTIRRVDRTSPGKSQRQVDDFLSLNRSGGQSLVSVLLGARDEAWVEGVRILRKRPVVGHGFGTGNMLFDHYDSRERFTNFVGGFASGTNPHNSYLQAVLELGIPGSILFFAPLILGLYFAIRGLRTRATAPYEAAFAAALAAVIFSAFFDSTLTQAGAMTMVSWIVTAAVLGFAWNGTLRAVERSGDARQLAFGIPSHTSRAQAKTGSRHL